MAFLNRDLNGVPAEMGFDPIPKGTYLAHIIESKDDTSKNDDLVLKITWMILEGEHEGRKVFDQIMLTGSDKAVAFGNRKLKTIAVASGHPNPNFIEDSEELHGLPCQIVVGVRTWEGAERNEVKDYKPASSKQPAAQPSPAAPPPPPQGPPPPAAATSTPPSAPPSAGPTKTAASPPPPQPGGAKSPFEPPAEGPAAA
jgi:hypothetical protein